MYLIACAALLVLLKIFQEQTLRLRWADVLVVSVGLWAVCRLQGTEAWDLCGLFLFYWAIRLARVKRMVWYAIFISGLLQAIIGQHYFPNIGPYGCFLALALIAGLGVWLTTDRFWEKMGLLPALGLLVVLLFFSDSRTAWLAAMAGCIALGWIYRQGKWRLLGARLVANKYFWWVSGGLLLTGLVVLYAYRPDSANGRLLIWLVGLRMWQQHLIAGVGTGGFQREFMHEQADYFRQYPDSDFILLADNNWFAFNEGIHLLCSWGLIGGILIGILTVHLIKGLHHQKNIAIGMAWGLLVISGFSYPASVLSLCVFYVFLCACLINEKENKPIVSFRLKTGLSISIGVLLLWVSGYVTIETIKNNKVEQALRKVITGREKAECIYAARSRIYKQPELLSAWGKWCYESQRYTEAADALTKAVQFRTTVEMWNDLGISLQKSGRSAEARECFKTASDMLPARIVSRYHLFCIYRDNGDREKADECAREILQLHVKIVNSRTLDIKREIKSYLQKNRSL